MGIKDFTPPKKIHSIGYATNCENAILKNTSNAELHLNVVRLGYVQAKTYKFRVGEIRNDIIAEDFHAGKKEIYRLEALGKIQIIGVPYGDICSITPSGLSAVEVAIGFGDWYSVDAGENWAVDIIHGLNTLYPTVNIYNGNNEIMTTSMIVVDANKIRLKVAQVSNDCRFAGMCKIIGS